MCLLPGFACGSGTNAGWEAGYIVRQVYRRVTNFSSLPNTVPGFDNTDKEKLAALSLSLGMNIDPELLENPKEEPQAIAE